MFISALIYKFAFGSNLDIYLHMYIPPASKDYSTTLVAIYVLEADLNAGLLSWSPFLHNMNASSMYLFKLMCMIVHCLFMMGKGNVLNIFTFQNKIWEQILMLQGKILKLHYSGTFKTILAKICKEFQFKEACKF